MKIKRQAWQLLFLLFFSLGNDSILAQVRFFKGYGMGEGSCVLPTKSGGYICVGVSQSALVPPASQVEYILTDLRGQVIWQHSDKSYKSEIAFSVVECSDGGFIIVGRGVTSLDHWGGGPAYGFYFKVDEFGNVVWRRSLSNHGSEIRCIRPTTDGNYIMTGMSSGGIFLMKIDEDGTTILFKSLGYPIYPSNSSIEQTSDGGYVIGWMSDSSRILKTNSEGEKEWVRVFSPGYYSSVAVQTRDECYAFAFSTSDSFGLYTALIKLDKFGNILWNKKLCKGQGEAYSLQSTPDNGFVISGSLYSGGNYSVMLLKANASGDSSWLKNFGGNNYDRGFYVHNTPDNGFIITGNAYYCGCIIKTDEFGNACAYGNDTLPLSQIADQTGFAIFPNPTSDLSMIELKENIYAKISVYNNLGQLLIAQNIQQFSTFDFSSFPTGQYLIMAEQINGKAFAVKLIKQ